MLGNAAGPAGVAPVPWGRTAPEPEDVEGRPAHAVARMGGITRRHRVIIATLPESPAMDGVRRASIHHVVLWSRYSEYPFSTGA